MSVAWGIKGVLPVNRGWFSVDKASIPEYYPILAGECGLRTTFKRGHEDELPHRLLVHLTHLPLLPGWAPGSGPVLGSQTAPATLEPAGPLSTPAWWEELKDEQREDALWTRERPGVLIANGLGSGKTRTALAGCRPPALIICKKSAVRRVWADELDYLGWSYTILEGRNVSLEAMEEPVHAWILNYHVAPAWLPYFGVAGMGPNPTTLIVDEAHMLQKRQLSWSQALRSLNPQLTIALTATPIRNRLRSFYGVLDAIAPRAFGHIFEFRVQYCGAVMGEYGLVDGEPSETALWRLRQRIRPILQKRDRDLAIPIHREISQIYVDRDDLARLQSAAAQDAIANVGKGPGIHLSWGNRERQLAGQLKVPSATQFLARRAGTDRVVGWFWHKDVLKATKEKLKELLPSNVKIDVLTGEITQSRRDKIITEWRDGDPHEPRVLLATIGAASDSIALTTAAHALFVENDWAPLQLQQAETRTHRYGQKHPACHVTYMTIPRTKDDEIAQALLEKAKEAEQVLGEDGQLAQMQALAGVDEEQGEASFMEDLANQIIGGIR